MIGWWRVSRVHMLAFAAGLLIVLGVLVRGTIERVNQINLVSSQAVLTAADAVSAAITEPVSAADWPAVQARVRAMASQHLRLRYRVVTADGAVMADSQQIKANGSLSLPLVKRALAERRALDVAGAQPYELVAALPLAGGAAALVIDASWERQYLEQRTAIEREAVAAALVLLVLITGVFVAVWRLGVMPLHQLRTIAKTLAAGCANPRAPAFRLADLNAIGRAVNQLADRADALNTQNLKLTAENTALHQEVDVLERAREEAESANAAKSEFLARMSHDLRTPLHGIIGFSEMIRDQLVGPIGSEKYADYARDIHQSGVHLLRLINDLLDLSKIEAGRFELVEDVVSVATTIEETIHALSPLAEARELTVTATLQPALPTLIADEKTLRQMLFNLLSNAIKFTDRGGQITVTATVNDQGLAVAVTDNGIGITGSDQDALFTGYGQGGNPRTRPAEGTGLGLVIVKSLIELHGGWLDLSSDPGTGTTITLVFPPERLSQ